jgi:four helix bundle protein
MNLVKNVYELTRDFPRDEIYGLVQQLRRAAVSVPSNIAEGAARSGKREFAQFLGIAKGSLSELETQLLISAELGYLKREDRIFGMVEKTSTLLAGLHRSISR